ncbi:PTS system mannose-specific EIIBCA component [Parageobacillus caldoxylosilyticus]|uniref:fructose PTS transporter subunit IIB n=1 Tax=Saccharococcus caldoxylosilyticus TaxID=81408 RepID=UPI001C4DDCC0|nr:PTS system mannose-specific EIIBCA component [Parageobacillus caldoxylosilyticus]BDG45388.1 hypothetical protein PcaKH35_37330 [Parageobacillus caldoxylosilyticus]
MKLLAITSCPNGIAHTYMAAEKLAKAAEKMGHEIKVETQGSIGVENELTPEDIQSADGVIIAADKQVDKSRFYGKRVLEASVTDGIRKPEELIAKFERNEVPVYGKPQSDTLKTIEEVKTERKQKQSPIYRNLMNGVSYMIPFVVIGGLLCVAFGVKRSGVDWDSLDGEKAQLIFMIAVPEEQASNEHLKILQFLSRKLMDDEFREHLLQAKTKEEIMQLFKQV